MTHPTGPDMTTSNRFSGTVAFVTGAGSGIGRATAVPLAEEGADVAVVGLDADENCETVRQIEALGARALGITYAERSHARATGGCPDPRLCRSPLDRRSFRC